MADEDALRAELAKLSPHARAMVEWRARFLEVARPKQVIDFSKDPRNTIFMHPGRGFGKNFTGVNWICWDLCREAMFGHVIAPTHNDTRFVIFEGESGVLRWVPPILIKSYNSSDLVLEFYNGSVLRGFSAEKPERLRGPQCFVAGTLVETAWGQVPIESVTIADRVKTRKGFRRVLAHGRTQRNADIWELTTARGHHIRGTMNHPVYVQGCGWIPLGELRIGDALVSSTTAASTIRAATDTTSTSAASGHAASGSAHASICTEAYTSRKLGLYPLVTSFITRTATRAITHLLTSWRSLQSGMQPITRRSDPLALASAQPCEHGSCNTGELARSSVANAHNVACASKLGHPTRESSAGLVVGMPIATTVSNPKPERVSPATLATQRPRVSNSTAANVALVTTEPRIPISGLSETCTDVVRAVRALPQKSDVFDIEVEGEPEFFANGILVHNCSRLWSDEISAWLRMRETYEQALFGLRLGDRALHLITSTPQPKELIRELMNDATVIKIGGHQRENAANLSPTYLDKMRTLEGTRLGRQELAGNLLDAEELGVVKRSQWQRWPHDRPMPAFEIIVMSLDTALSEENVDVKKQVTDFTACTVWGGFREKPTDSAEALRRDQDEDRIRVAVKQQPKIVLLDAWQERLGFPELVERVKREKDQRYGNDTTILRPALGDYLPTGLGRRPDIILIEDKNSGISLRQMLRRDGIPVVPYNPGHADKYLRLNLVAPLFVGSYVHAVTSERREGEFKSWAETVVAQVCAYSGEGSLEHDDSLDSATQALLWLQRNWLHLEPPVYQRRGVVRTPEGANPYGS